MSKIKADNTVFYSTANAGYAVYAAVSLMTVRDYLPDARLCILSSGLSDSDRKILDRQNISYHEIDLSHEFTDSWEYPVDCYYLFAGPELLYKQGYEYSVYIDGDTLCTSNPIARVGDIHGIASAEQANNNVDIFGEDWNILSERWGLSKSNSTQKRINSGVVYFNNRRMSNVQLLSKAGELFRECIRIGAPRKGDDSLLALLQHVYLQDDVKYLPATYNYVLQFNEWLYPIDNLVFFHFSIGKPWKIQPYQHEESALEVCNPYVRLWRLKFRQVAFWRWLESTPSGRIYNLLQKSGATIKRLLRDQILWMAGLKKSYLVRYANAHGRPIRLYWWRGLADNATNFGDEITGDILCSIFGYQYSQTSIETCELIGAGSILEIAERRQNNNAIKVWGSGFISEVKDEDNLSNLDFYAVRGKKTQLRVGRDIALGDPGLLASVVYPCARYRTEKVGIVVHYIDADLPLVKKIREDPRFLIINPLDHPKNVALKVSSCKLILSSSLHGLIFADSFGIPNKHVKLSDRLTGGVYKFEDYYSALGRFYSAADTSRIFDDEYLEDIKRSYVAIKNLSSIQRKLINSFPKYGKV